MGYTHYFPHEETTQEYSITIDTNKQWERVYTTTVQRIVDLVKGEANK